MFSLKSTPLNRDEMINALQNERAGAIVVFEGWVRNHNLGKPVSSLEYQVYEELAQKEGEKILAEAKVKFNLHHAVTVHRFGHLHLGEVAVWIGATASHRDDAFKATRYIIDEIKHRLPVWKKEHYLDEKPEWVFCKHHHHHVHFTEADYYQKQAILIDQQTLKNKRVLVVGAGGLGCPALVGLASAGVGQINIMDFDRIHISNIHRQMLYSPNLAGEKKALVARSKILELNPLIKSEAILERFEAITSIEGYDLILDCTDNMETKFLIHDACFKKRIPLISASIYQFEGQIRTFKPGSEEGCLRCHVKETPADHLLGNCNDMGVLGASTNALGSLQASEAITFLNEGKNESLQHSLFINLKNFSTLKIKNSAVSDCMSCSGKYVFASEQLEIGPEAIGEYKLIDIRQLNDQEIYELSSASKPMVLYCHRGIRSKKLVENLRDKGHSHFYSLKGGACSL